MVEPPAGKWDLDLEEEEFGSDSNFWQAQFFPDGVLTKFESGLKSDVREMSCNLARIRP